MAYTDIDDPSVHFQVKAFAGTGSSNAVTYDGNSDMQPDLLWFKNRQQALNWMMWDSVRGITKYFYSNLTEAEGTTSTVLTAIGSDGFTVGANNNVNQSSNNIINYGWKTGTSFTNDASATGIGSIDSTGSVNTTSGFSVISLSGTGSALTAAHGLGVKPSMIIFKARNIANNWLVYHKNVGATKTLFLDRNVAEEDNSIWFNDTEPTSSVFSLGTWGGMNTASSTVIAYCFAEKQGYSKFGSYTGNGNVDGPFCFTGFLPAFVLTKTASSTYQWSINDNKRNTFNPTDKRLYPSTSGAEATSDSYDIDFLSNGFKIRSSSVSFNQSGDNVIYMAFAENPFVTSTGVPATAR